MMLAKFAHVIGWREELHATWGQCYILPSGGEMEHFARHIVAEGDGEHGGELVLDKTNVGWDGACEKCGLTVDWSVAEINSAAVKRRYDTPSGELEPGNLFWMDWYHYDDGEHYCYARWTNCDGRHLGARVPTGDHWDIDSRARNCGLTEDTVHRCWIRHGDPETELVTVDKNGLTCVAGAGSIQTNEYHGFLQNGLFT